MEHLNPLQPFYTYANAQNGGMPTIPSGKQPYTEQKISDPSSSFPNGERYPIPSFFEYRLTGRDSH
ncbi:MAG: hypothetical protein H0U44_12800 [Flavisolibacter sp.]|nr:hypothetical protein [Flavisolibacter sp.]